jgi:hypothetical protein
LALLRGSHARTSLLNHFSQSLHLAQHDYRTTNFYNEKPRQQMERCVLCPGNVHSANGWGDVLKPVVARYQGKPDPDA